MTKTATARTAAARASSTASAASIDVTVVHATPVEVIEVVVRLAPDASVADALAASAVTQSIAAVLTPNTPVGIYGRRVDRDAMLRDGDRVEIYRTLKVDPKEARRRRAKLSKLQG